MISPWQCPLPVKEYKKIRVIVYAYDGTWNVLMSCHLAQAIALYSQVLMENREIFIFPCDLNPDRFQDGLNSTVLVQPEATKVPDSLDIAVEVNFWLSCLC
ncbi:hypothetical protein NUACC21_31920 [Scytonema sp. NUACC21]